MSPDAEHARSWVDQAFDQCTDQQQVHRLEAGLNDAFPFHPGNPLGLLLLGHIWAAADRRLDELPPPVEWVWRQLP